MSTRQHWRERLYAGYVTRRREPLAPSTLTGLGPRAPYLQRVVARHFPADRDARILDIGCGHGALMHFARQAGYRQVAGVDTSPEQVAAASRLGIDGVAEGDLLDALTKRADGSLDVLVALDVIEHFARDELLALVDEVYRVLRSGGRWIMHVPNGESPFGGRIRYGDLTHELAFTRRSLSQLILSSNFSELECFEDAPVVHGIRSALRWTLWKAFRGLLYLYMAVETGELRGPYIFSQNMLAVATK